MAARDLGVEQRPQALDLGLGGLVVRAELRLPTSTLERLQRRQQHLVQRGRGRRVRAGHAPMMSPPVAGCRLNGGTPARSKVIGPWRTSPRPKRWAPARRPPPPPCRHRLRPRRRRRGAHPLPDHGRPVRLARGSAGRRCRCPRSPRGGSTFATWRATPAPQRGELVRRFAELRRRAQGRPRRDGQPGSRQDRSGKRSAKCRR